MIGSVVFSFQEGKVGLIVSEQEKPLVAFDTKKVKLIDRAKLVILTNNELSEKERKKIRKLTKKYL